VRVAFDDLLLDSGADGRAVAPRVVLAACWAVDLVEHGVVDLRAEREPHGGEVAPVAVRVELDAVGEPGLWILHERQGIVGRAFADEP
jgi:hypothetical protein